MPRFVSRSYRDRSNEPSSISLRLRENFADQAAENTAITALEAALDGVSAGKVVGRAVSTREKLGTGPSVNAGAQREVKILVTYGDTVTFDVYNQEIPIADQNAITFVSANSDEIDLADGDVGEELKTQLEASVVSKAGNPISVTRAILVGRNL
jgi:hypothetical protein